MTTSTPGTSPGSEPVPDDPQAVREDIAQTRRELGDTVEALAAKADVKARAQATAAEVTTAAKQQATGAAAAVGAKAREVTDQAAAAVPEPAQQAVGQAARAARPWGRPMALAVGVAVLVGWMRRQRRRRRGGWRR